MIKDLLLEIHQELKEVILDRMTDNTINTLEKLLKLFTSIEVMMKRKAATRKANGQKAESKENKPEETDGAT